MSYKYGAYGSFEHLLLVFFVSFFFFFLLLFFFPSLLLARQIATSVSSMKMAVHCGPLRLPLSLPAMGMWSVQIPFLGSS